MNYKHLYVFVVLLTIFKGAQSSQYDEIYQLNKDHSSGKIACFDPKRGATDDLSLDVQRCCFLSITHNDTITGEPEYILAHIDYRFLSKDVEFFTQTLQDVSQYVVEVNLHSNCENILLCKIADILQKTIGQERTKISFQSGIYFGDEGYGGSHKFYIDEENLEVASLFSNKEKADWVSVFYNNFTPFVIGINSKTGERYNSYPLNYFSEYDAERNKRIRDYQLLTDYCDKIDAAARRLDQFSTSTTKSLMEAFKSLGLAQGFILTEDNF